ncbi:FecR family protein [Fibrella sp. WM1]|uniref:FecR family protein n=1 Tax=Fibrella musci TaxID=3242485 RepID=UPI00351F9A03
MKRYLQYHVDDFVWDLAFRQWVLTPTRETEAQWRQWLVTHPDKAPLIDEARALVLALQPGDLPLSDQEIQQAVQRTIERTRQRGQSVSTAGSASRPVPLYQRPWLRVAAALLLLLGITGWLWLNYLMTDDARRPALVSYEQLVTAQKQTLMERFNQTKQTIPVKLQDGSLVLLKPGSRLSYVPEFRGTRREVYLSGEAFFEVAKDASKPFLIYANGLTTKVLGTSFLIKAYPKDPNVTVEVKTGRVAVFARKDPTHQQKVADRDLTGLVLIPNQKIVFEREQARLAKSLVDNPQLLPGPSQKNPFVFDDTPLPTVFTTLERAYGVNIVFDSDLLANCPLTAELTDQPLFEKLDIICRVIEAHYDVMDGQIVVYSHGCKP